jgi:hypothetical protein
VGEIVKRGEETVYRQMDGEITASLDNFSEKMELVHEGSRKYKHIFHLLVATGLVYLIVIFIFY